MTFVPSAEDFRFSYDKDHHFGFFEDEDARIFTFGHVDPKKLLASVKEYDELLSGDVFDGEYDDNIKDVRHTWAIIVTEPEDAEDSDWRFTFGDKYEGKEFAFPLTVWSR